MRPCAGSSVARPRSSATPSARARTVLPVPRPDQEGAARPRRASGGGVAEPRVGCRATARVSGEGSLREPHAAHSRPPAARLRAAPRRAVGECHEDGWTRANAEIAPRLHPQPHERTHLLPGVAARAIDEGGCTDVRVRRDDSRQHRGEGTIARRAMTVPAHDCRIGTCPCQRREVGLHRRRCVTHGRPDPAGPPSPSPESSRT